jgi:predicted Zn finger-like uncharacterized protein
MQPGESTTRSFPGVISSATPRPAIDRQSSYHREHSLTPAERLLRRVRRAIASTLLALALLVATRLWMVDGILRSVRIEGPSMAGAFDGAHFRLVCKDCAAPFRCDAHDLPATGKAVCPNCGYKDNPLEQSSLTPGERVLVDRWPTLWQTLERGQVVAARAPGSSGEFIIKRVAALPEEQFAIRGGDLYADSELIRKTPRQWRELRVLVHDNAFQPRTTPSLPPRWRPAEDTSLWKSDGQGFQHAAERNDRPVQSTDWLEFQPWRCTAHGARGEIVPLMDNDSYNQGLDRRLNDVSDVGFTGRIFAADKSRFVLAARDGEQNFEIRFDLAANECQLVANDAILETRDRIPPFDQRGLPVDLALCDQQIMLTLDGRTVFRHAYRRRAQAGSATRKPLAIGAMSGRLRVTELRVWRDIYYLDPLGTNQPWQLEQPLAPDAAALLGDNPPVSIDSRNWQPAGIPLRNIVGRVYHPFWTSETPKWLKP